jgi:hypothetical protein
MHAYTTPHTRVPEHTQREDGAASKEREGGGWRSRRPLSAAVGVCLPIQRIASQTSSACAGPTEGTVLKPFSARQLSPVPEALLVSSILSRVKTTPQTCLRGSCAWLGTPAPTDATPDHSPSFCGFLGNQHAPQPLITQETCHKKKKKKQQPLQCSFPPVILPG